MWFWLATRSITLVDLELVYKFEFSEIFARAVFVGRFGGSTPLSRSSRPPPSYLLKCSGVDWNPVDPLLPLLELDSKGMHCVCVNIECSLHHFTLSWCDFQVQNALNSKFSGAGALTVLPQTPSWWEGGSLFPLQEPHPRSLSALRTSSVGSSGLALSRPPC